MTIFPKMCNITHFLLVIGKGCQERWFHNMCSVTHRLLVIEKGVVRLTCTKCTIMSLTCCWSHENMWWDWLSQDVQCHSQTVGIEKTWQNCLSQNVQCYLLLASQRHSCDRTAQNVQCYSHTVGHRWRCDETALHKMCDVTHSLLVIWKNVMKLTSWNVQGYSLTVVHRKKCEWDHLSQNVQCAILTDCWS
jgi:hypothetical protein